MKLAEREAAEASFRRSRRPQQLKGPGGASGETLAVESSNGTDESTAPRAAPTEEQIAQVRAAIGAASSLEEVQKLVELYQKTLLEEMGGAARLEHGTNTYMEFAYGDNRHVLIMRPEQILRTWSWRKQHSMNTTYNQRH